MVEQIDKLINNLKILKEEKISSDEKTSKVFQIFQTEKESFDKSSNLIYEKVDALKKEVEIMDEEREIFFEKLEKILAKNLVNLEEFKTSDIKRFYKRESLLSDLMKKDDYQTIYNIFFAFFVMQGSTFLLQAMIEDQILFNFRNFFGHLNGLFEVVKFIFFKIIISMLIVFLLNVQIKYKGRNKNNFLYSGILMIIFLSFFLISYFFIPGEDCSLTIKIIHYVDNLRFLVKLKCYFLEKVLLYTCKKLDNDQETKIEHNNKSCILSDDGEKIKFYFEKVCLKNELTNFLYYLYTPTLIYRDKYPTIKKVDFLNILIHCTNLIFSISFLFLLYELKFSPLTDDKSFDFLKKDFISSLVMFGLNSMIVLFVTFFGISHSYCNLFAEILKFADKNFYSDFFNSATPNDFLNKITNCIDDYVEYYISNFSDCFFPKSFCKILILCIFTEYIISSSMNSFCPIASSTIILWYFISFIFDYINCQQKSYFNWLVISSFTGVSMLALFVEYIVVYYHKDLNNENNILDIAKHNYIIYSVMPKILFLV